MGENREITHLHRETVKLATQQLIQIEQLAALAFPSHPSSLAWVVDAVAMEKEKRSHVFPGVSFIELADQCRTQSHERTLIRRGLIRIRQIGEDGKVKIAVVVTEEAYLQIFYQALHLFFIE